MASKEEPAALVQRDLDDDAALEQMGYQPELKRTFGLLGMIGFSFSIVTCWTVIGGTLILGFLAGGPPLMVWGWILTCLLTLPVAYSLAEMASAYPTAGGQYSWVAILAPRSVARGTSYVTGWFNIMGVMGIGGLNQFICANFILGMVNLSNPSYVIERWHVVLVTYLVSLWAVAVNIWAPQLLDKISRISIGWNLMSFATIVIVILACNDKKQSAHFVFRDFQNYTGFSDTFAVLIGCNQLFLSMCCYEAPAHMVEEMRDARKQAPVAIVSAVYLGAVTGFIFLVSVYFCVGNPLQTAKSATGVPLIQIFYDSTGSVGGACVLATLVLILFFFAQNALTAESSRIVFAFARDRGLPFSDVFGRLEPRKKIPIPAILVSGVVQCAFCSVYFGTITGFNTVVSIGTAGYYISYMILLAVRLVARFWGHQTNLSGPYSLGRYGLALNIIGFLFLAFACIVLNFPAVSPVTDVNMNYCSATIGATMAIAAVTWLTTGYRQFTGPDRGRILEAIDAERREKNAPHDVEFGAT